MTKFRAYFLQKVTLSSSLNQAFYALHGLKVTSKTTPFLKVMDQSESKVRFQFFDMIGSPVSGLMDEAQVTLVSNTNQSIDVSDHATIN